MATDKMAEEENNIDKKIFAFNPSNLKRAKEIIAKYPDGRQKSAIIPLLDIAQRQNAGWLSTGRY